MPAEPTELQRLVNRAFAGSSMVDRLEVVLLAESLDLPYRVRAIVTLLPPGRYSRQQLCDQLNSAITAHGYGTTLGTVE